MCVCCARARTQSPCTCDFGPHLNSEERVQWSGPHAVPIERTVLCFVQHGTTWDTTSTLHDQNMNIYVVSNYEADLSQLVRNKRFKPFQQLILAITMGFTVSVLLMHHTSKVGNLACEQCVMLQLGGAVSVCSPGGNRHCAGLCVCAWHCAQPFGCCFLWQCGNQRLCWQHKVFQVCFLIFIQ